MRSFWELAGTMQCYSVQIYRCEIMQCVNFDAHSEKKMEVICHPLDFCPKSVWNFSS